jgi:hypothetical protein
MLTMSATRRGPPLRRLQQVREGGAGGVEQALHVDGDHAVPLPGVRAGDGAQQHQAGIVDQRVQPPEPPGGLLDGRLGLGAVGDVGFHGQRGATRLADLGGESFQTVPAAGNERHGGTVLGEPAGGGSADAAARASDQGGGAGRFRFHGVLSCSLEVRRRGRRQGRHLNRACVLPVPVPVPAREPVRLTGSGGRWVT